MLQVTDLHKSFDQKEILKGMSFSVEDGEIYGFIGHNGAGKTTTIRCCVGILEHEQGIITIGGKDLAKEPVACKQMLAYIPDNPDLYENLTCIQYLNFVADIFGMSSEGRLDKINSLAKELEIYDQLGDQIKTLSHGMKQKIAVISAFMHDPRLLVLDEPFVGLDPKSTYVLKQKMRQLCDSGASVFFSSHVLEVVENLCDHIAILKEGQIIRQGTTQEIVHGGQTLEEVFLELEGNE
ncbi:MAG: ABC transporter ATP-binding protein [Solobacterium sp.]|jgi:ABC-2 type transport system ATP-binding protein|nr:ABC transporter ATP-binding protein [Solobacterium sp.]MCH4222407.1 ABC transporter ATP-binding protein [Solobacterium sp.]MCH4265944.1 ABC transporter ATP-binding protein [Solobacterium sp.]